MGGEGPESALEGQPWERSPSSMAYEIIFRYHLCTQYFQVPPPQDLSKDASGRGMYFLLAVKKIFIPKSEKPATLEQLLGGLSD